MKARREPSGRPKTALRSTPTERARKVDVVNLNKLRREAIRAGQRQPGDLSIAVREQLPPSTPAPHNECTAFASITCIGEL